MNVLTKYRLLFITLFFIVISFCISLLITIKELQTYFYVLSPIVGIVMTLVVGAIVQHWLKEIDLKRFAIIAGILLAAFIVAILFYSYLFNNTTFKFVDANDKASYYVKGNKSSYSAAALDFKKTNPGISDDELIRLGFVNPEMKTWAWSESSIKQNVIWLVTGYCILVLIFSSLLAFLIEYLMMRNTKKVGRPFSTNQIIAGSKKKGEIQIFYSYAHTDDKLRKKLETHLSVFKQNGYIKNWSDSMIDAGENWNNAINENLMNADIILLLVSAAFLSSEYINSIEVSTALDRHRKGETIVIPIILRDVNWKQAPFADLQALPSGGKAVTGAYWKNQDAAFKNISEGIEKVILKLI